VSNKVRMEQIEEALELYAHYMVAGFRVSKEDWHAKCLALIRQYGQDNSIAERERCLAIVRKRRDWVVAKYAITTEKELQWQLYIRGEEGTEIERRINSGEQPS